MKDDSLLLSLLMVPLVPMWTELAALSSSDQNSGPHSLVAAGRDQIMELVTKTGLEARMPTANLSAGQELGLRDPGTGRLVELGHEIRINK